MAQVPNPPFSYQDFRIKMLLAKRADVPIAPPVRPVFSDPSVLSTLGQLQFHHADDSFKRLMVAPPDDPPFFLFAHPL
jgi:hypothetical protein